MNVTTKHSQLNGFSTNNCMCLQVVAFQAMMQYMAENFPGAFAGYELSVTESHQNTKVDTSGTAKAVVASLQKMGPNFDVVSMKEAACFSSILFHSNYMHCTAIAI